MNHRSSFSVFGGTAFLTELMSLSGLSRNLINKLYRETNIETTQLETLFKLCDAFNCKLSYRLRQINDAIVFWGLGLVAILLGMKSDMN
ncbi:helix-turn-helix domain-containing protein [Paenibacillus sp. RC73]|uniref:helix-turn-helix domain-containing protein n=1 Tax=Paenibacillus sp. RC73 TaxID=3156250 RepID=UPI00384E5254